MLNLKYLGVNWLFIPCSLCFIAGNVSYRNTSSLAVDGSRWDCSFEIVRPADEKTLSDGADVAGIHKYFIANSLSKGKS